MASRRGNRGWAVLAVFVITTVLAASAVPAQAQIFTILHSFDYTDGAEPAAALFQASPPPRGIDGDLYGTTVEGGPHVGGTVFQITPSGTLTTAYSFCSKSACTDGEYPSAGLVQTSDGTFYGTTSQGGAYGEGTVFKITVSGARATLTTLYSFCSESGCADGERPQAALALASNGDLYGTTVAGGATDDGTVFKITPSGTLTTLHSFCSQSACADGAYPDAGLVQGADGNFYGTAYQGGTNSVGTIFKLTPSGTLTTLYSFCSQSGCADGSYPLAPLVQATDGNFYGTTSTGGANGTGTGTVFKITSGGALTTLYSFCSQSGCTDGAYPQAALIQATDGNFYGTTIGRSGGTVFKITSSGALTTLHSFCSQSGCPDGADPTGGLVQDTNGAFYGTAFQGGAYNWGIVFRLSVGLGPFVKTQPTSGNVGATVNIEGNNLTGATSVSFNGTVAVFNVLSSSLISTTVPAGATTGTVQVVTRGGTLSSNVPFRVLP